MPSQEYSVAITESLNSKLNAFLLNDPTEEEICFALWNPVQGSARLTAVIHEIILPEEGDRKRHGTVSAYPKYLDRVKDLARRSERGIVMIHTHPMWGGPQGVSRPDLHYEQDVLAREVYGVTGLPLVGMTLAGDGAWSARFYPRPFKIRWCPRVRIVGKNLKIYFNPQLAPAPRSSAKQLRTVSVWGEQRQADLARMKVGIVGVGSVGSAVADILARMGVCQIVILDYDRVKPHNLDRMPGVTSSDIGMSKTDVVARNVKLAATGTRFTCEKYEHSVVEEEGFRKALDCDVLFSCVDRPWPRQVLNHLSYTSLIPVIDGGVSFRTKGERLIHGMYRTQTVGPERACMQCVGALDSGQIQMDRDGIFDDPQYIETLGADSSLVNARNNIIPFVYSLAGLETTQFVELVTNLAKTGDLGQQPYNYHTGEIRPAYHECVLGCEYVRWAALGDKMLPVLGKDKSKERDATKA